MASLDVYSTSGKKTSNTSVKKKLFEAKINPDLMAQSVRVYLSNQRQAPAKTKSRGEVKVTKKKVWRQKGTGRARHGSRNAPIFVGGGKAHGPSGTQNFKLKMSKKMRQASLFSALSEQFKAKKIICLTGLSKLEPKTKTFHKTFTSLNKTPKNLLLILPQKSDTQIRSTRNLPYLTTTNAQSLNTYQVLNARQLIFTKKALKDLETHYAK